MQIRTRHQVDMALVDAYEIAHKRVLYVIAHEHRYSEAEKAAIDTCARELFARFSAAEWDELFERRT